VAQTVSAIAGRVWPLAVRLDVKANASCLPFAARSKWKGLSEIEQVLSPSGDAVNPEVEKK
jgi:hypothetical protein